MENEIVGRNISIIILEPFRSEHYAHIKRPGTIDEMNIEGASRQVTGKKKDGTTFPMELAVTEVIENNEIIFLASVHDLSTEKYYETSLQKAEEKIRQSQEYAEIAYWRYDLLTKQMDCSDNFKTIHGFLNNGDDTFHAETLLTCTHPDDKKLLLNSFSQCLAGINKGVIEVEYRIININGIVQWMYLKGAVEKNNEGQPIFIHGVVQDITRRKNSESRGITLEKIIDKAQIEIYIIDLSTFKFIEVNELARDNLGYVLDELQVLTLLDIKKGLKEEDFYHILEPLFSGEQESIAFQSELYRRNGSTYPVDVKLQLMPYDGQEVCIAFIEDITARINIMKELHDACHVKSLFISQMIHELRISLNTILGFSQFMRFDEQNPLTIDQSLSNNEIFKAGKHILDLFDENGL